MSRYAFITPPDTPCPVCRVTDWHAHNIACSATGERSYRLAVNVTARTVEALRIPQGAGVHTKPSAQ